MPSNVTRSFAKRIQLSTALTGGVIKMLWTARGLVQMVKRDRADP